MINYELAKKLKEAGFPNKDCEDCVMGTSLSELIEAVCKLGGERDFRLVRDDNGWRARCRKIEMQEVNWTFTPEESVAQLYLSLSRMDKN